MPRRIGPYEAVAPLTMGGMAELWLGTQRGARGFRRPIVLKLVRPELLGGHTPAAAFLDEAKLGAALDHPNLARVLDAALDPQTRLPFVALELISGIDAQRVLARCEQLGRRVPVAIACRVVRDVCRGLHCAHTHKDAKGKASPIIHRDVAPKNVMLTFDGRAVLIDFGIARAKDRLVLTRPGIVKGTVGYMAPEQIRGEPLDGRSDQFSAAIVLAELLSGRPFSADPEASDEQQRLANGSFDLGWVRQLDVPDAVRSVLLRGLAPEREGRFPSCKALATALEAACPALADDAAWRDFLGELFPKTAQVFAMAVQAVEANDAPLAEQRLETWRASLAGNTQATTVVGPIPTEPSPARPSDAEAPATHALGWAVGGTALVVLAVVAVGALVLLEREPPPPKTADAPQRAEDRQLAAAAAYEAAGDLARAMAVLRECRIGEVPCPRAAGELARLEAKLAVPAQPPTTPDAADDELVPLPLPTAKGPGCSLPQIDRQVRALDWEAAGDGLRTCLESDSLRVVRAAEARLAQLAAGQADRCALQEAQRALGQRRFGDARWLATTTPNSAVFREARQRVLSAVPKKTKAVASVEAVQGLWSCAQRMPGDATALARLGDGYVALGQLGPARATYERFLALAPEGHPQLNRIRNFLDRLVHQGAPAEHAH